MIDPSVVELGSIWILVIIIYKLLGKIPYLKDNATHELRERVVKAIEDFSAESKIQTRHLEELNECHTNSFARRPDGTYRWYNNPDRESDIQETRALVGEIHKDVKEIKEGGE